MQSIDKTLSHRFPILKLAASVLFLALAGCGGGDGGSSSSTEFACPNTTAAAPQACCDVANSIIDACVRCGLSSRSGCVSQVTTSISSASRGQGCAGADQVRDSQQFYNDCLPGLDALSCTDLKAGALPASCTDQIEYVQ